MDAGIFIKKAKEAKERKNIKGENMKISYISDLHLDFYSKSTNPQDHKFSLRIAEFIDKLLPFSRDNLGDVLILAGDHGHYNSQTKELLKQLKEIYKEVIIVSGNHDLYLISDSQRKKYEWESIQRLHELKKDAEELGVHYLDGNVIEIDGVRFGGTAGWYSLPTGKDIEHWKYALNDSNLIYDGYPIGSAYSYGARSKPDWDTQGYYKEQLQKLKDIAEEGCDVLITHVAQVVPPNEAIPARFRNDHGNIFYYVDNEDVVKETGCRYYIYGHTHDEQIYNTDGLGVLCNPFGYPAESRGTRIKTFEI